MRLCSVALFALAVCPSVSYSQDRSYDERIKPQQLGLPEGTSRTSEPFVVRIYKKDTNDSPSTTQPTGYPFTITSDYTLKDDEVARTHQGIDFTSRVAGRTSPVPVDFKAGVYGVVVKAGDGPWGTITVQIHDGTLIQYLHTTASHVKVDDVVAPNTSLGVTGRTGAGAIHLHVQAKDKNGNPISPDLAFKVGQKKLQSEEKPDKSLIEFDPDSYSPVKAKVVDRRVSALAEPESKWTAEVIGMGGKVDLVLGEFYDYQSASYCSRSWSEANPNDLRLTHEREIKLKAK